ncbi:MAG TPA: ankyrin repeat domain-containing protein, partial [Longimicrobiales bacterium]|nr:ankyrin repeat domain-containing protein [Longimicrobiales bacterium]
MSDGNAGPMHARAGGLPGAPMRRRRWRTSVLLGVALTLGALAAPDESPVADAAQRADLDAVRSLVREGADVNAAQPDGMTALHWAALNDDAAIVRLLVNAGADLASTTRLGGYTALHLAARGGLAGPVAALLEGGSDPSSVSETGVAPLHFAAESGDVASVRALLEHGADVDQRDGHGERTPLMFATARGRIEAMRALLAAGADVTIATRVVDYAELAREDQVERRQRARMMAAARGEDPEPAQGGRGQGGRQPGAPAAERPDTARPDVARPDTARPSADPPLPASADPDSPTRLLIPSPGQETEPEGKKEPERAAPAPLSYSDLVGRQGGMTALHYAARDGRAEEAMLLLEAGADVNAVTGGDRSTPLLVAVINGNYDLAIELLARGADPNLVSEDGAGPLFAAV